MANPSSPNTIDTQSDPYDLMRFIQAQENVYPQVIRELTEGRKSSHWIWYIFPQVSGLGYSATSKAYAIKSQAEALAYIRHPILGQRLRECANLLLQLEGATAYEILGSPDDMKVRSCLTLFSQIAPEEPVFTQVLDRFYGGEMDPLTLAILRSWGT